MVIDQTGDLANMKRHDYLPFGEELFAPISGRSAAQGYAGGDGVRQQFTIKERDPETGLDYFLTRYHSTTQGRFISVDPENYQARLTLTDPQAWNGYSYVGNNPLARIDPTGKGEFWEKFKNVVLHGCRCTDVEVEKRAQADEDKRRQELRDYSQMRGLSGYIIISGPDGQSQAVTVDSLDRSQVLTISQTIRYLNYGIQVGGVGTIEHGDALNLINAAITGIPATVGPTVADQISNGHAWSKHQGEFPGWSQQRFSQKIQETINKATGADVRNLSNGRTAYWNNNEGMVVIRDPSSPHGGTAFRPANGRVYFDNLH
jgi:filamentous hemagglutinin